MVRKKNRGKKNSASGSAGVVAPIIPGGGEAPAAGEALQDGVIGSPASSCPLNNLKKDHGAFLKEVESASATAKATAAAAASAAAAAATAAASAAAAAQPPKIQIKTEVVEKIVEKIVPDPKVLKQLEEIRCENEDLRKKLEAVESAKEALEQSVETSVETSSAKDEDHSAAVARLEAENKGLAEKILNYQDILANTESLLKTLQKSVENEESIWHAKLVQKEEALKEVEGERKALALRVSEMQAALETVKRAEEMESQLNGLKERLSREEEDKGRIQEQLAKAQEQIKAAAIIQVVSANGPPASNGVNCHESVNTSINE